VVRLAAVGDGTVCGGTASRGVGTASFGCDGSSWAGGGAVQRGTRTGWMEAPARGTGDSLTPVATGSTTSATVDGTGPAAAGNQGNRVASVLTST